MLNKEIVANKFLVEIFPDDLEKFLGGSFSAIRQCRMEDTRCIHEEMQKYPFWGSLVGEPERFLSSGR